MNAILIATIGYFLISLENVASKFLLGVKIKSWKLYVFYVGLMSIFAFFLVPGISFVVFGSWGVTYGSGKGFSFSILSGSALFVHLAFLYRSLQKSTASRTYVFSGAISLIVVFILAGQFLEETFSARNLAGLTMLFVGGLAISLKIDPIRYPETGRKKVKRFEGFRDTALAGFFLALSLLTLKASYAELGFVSGYVFSRLGLVLATGFALLFSGFRKDVAIELGTKNKKGKTGRFLAVVLTKILAGTGTLLVYIAISLGSVTTINALQSVQYLFTFIFSLLLTAVFGKTFAENLAKANVLYKSLGVLLVICGIIFASI